MLLSLLPVGAMAGPLVTGAVRDADGYVVAGASVRLFGDHGANLGSAVTAPDGTFAVDALGEPLAAEIGCRYCMPLRVPVRSGEPVTAFVRRSAALRDGGPGSDDLAALPYGSAAALAGLIPFAVTTGGALSDRGLNRGQGAVTVDGVPSYRILDGGEALDLVPRGALSRVAGSGPENAPALGALAGGGSFALTTLGPASVGAGTGASGGSALLRLAGANAAATLAQAAGGGGTVRRATGTAAWPMAGGRFALLAALAADTGAASAGGRLDFTTASRSAQTRAGVSASRSVVGGAGTDAALRADLSVLRGGPLGLGYGFRAARATASDPAGVVAGFEDEAAVFVTAAASGGWGGATASIALQRNGAVVAGGARGSLTALLPAVTYARDLGGAWSVRSAAGGAEQTAYLTDLAGSAYFAPVAPFARASTVDLRIVYDDGARLRAEAMVYAQRGDPVLAMTGVGGGVVWQASPQIALRGWVLDGHDGPYRPAYTPAYAYLNGYTVASPVLRQVVWLTFRGGFRVDAIVRGSGLDADAVVRLSPRAALVLGEAHEASVPATIRASVRFP